MTGITGREMINYIIKHRLENEEIITKNGIIGFISEDIAAEKFNVGKFTIRVWVNQDKMFGININGILYVPEDAVDPRLMEMTNVENIKEIVEYENY